MRAHRFSLIAPQQPQNPMSPMADPMTMNAHASIWSRA